MIWCDIFHMTPADLQSLTGRSPEARRLVIDHDHTSGFIRGLLCDLRNAWVGIYEAQENGHSTAGRKSKKYQIWRGYHAVRIKACVNSHTGISYSEKIHPQYWQREEEHGAA